MKRILVYFSSNWWRTFLLFISSSVLFIAYMLLTDEASKENQFEFLISLLVFLLYGIILLWFIIVSIFSLIRRKVLIKTLILTAMITGALYAILFLLDNVRTMFQPDRFAEGLTIPENIDLNIPKGERFSDGYSEANPDMAITKPDFEIYNTSLPGIYELVVWINNIEKGTVYLKAYEVTGEYPLSTYQVQQNSAINISKLKDEIQEFGPSTFTISEGDWGQSYAARFEVWFLPDETNKAERKLMEKTYKIEGYSN